MQRLRHLAGVLAIALAVTGCQTIQDGAGWLNKQLTTGSAPQANTVAAAEGFYTAIDKAATSAIQSGVLSTDTVKNILALDNKVYAQLVPLRQAAESGNSVAIPALLAAYNTAFGDFYNATQSNGIKVTLPQQQSSIPPPLKRTALAEAAIKESVN